MGHFMDRLRKKVMIYECLVKVFNKKCYFQDFTNYNYPDTVWMEKLGLGVNVKPE